MVFMISVFVIIPSILYSANITHVDKNTYLNIQGFLSERYNLDLAYLMTFSKITLLFYF